MAPHPYENRADMARSAGIAPVNRAITG